MQKWPGCDVKPHVCAFAPANICCCKKNGKQFCIVAKLVNAVIAKARTVVFTKCTAAANLSAELCTHAPCTATTIFCCCSSWFAAATSSYILSFGGNSLKCFDSKVFFPLFWEGGGGTVGGGFFFLFLWHSLAMRWEIGWRTRKQVNIVVWSKTSHTSLYEDSFHLFAVVSATHTNTHAHTHTYT